MSSDERAQPSLINDNPEDLTHSSAVYRAFFSEQIRKGAEITTAAVGFITDPLPDPSRDPAHRSH